MCGEKYTIFYLLKSGLGSPPRVRGKVQGDTSLTAQMRITPACAGKSRYNLNQPVVSGDHPRVCGEKARTPANHTEQLGSPPRVRGKVRGHLSVQVFPVDHPRVCGEKSATVSVRVKNRGSPPRVRGKANYSGKIWVTCRITPACAGKRLPKKQWDNLGKDHPRVCGEK